MWKETETSSFGMFYHFSTEFLDTWALCIHFRAFRKVRGYEIQSLQEHGWFSFLL